MALPTLYFQISDQVKICPKTSENAQTSESAQNCAFMLKDDSNCGAFLHLMV